MRHVLILAIFIAASARGEDLRVDYVRESLTGTHTHYQQYIDGIPVVGGERIEHRDLHGRLSVEAENGCRLPVQGASSQKGTNRQPATGSSELVYLSVNGIARLATRQIENRVAIYRDATSGEVLRIEPRFFTAAARVFDVNPVVKLNDPSLRDHGNAASAVPDAAYSIVDLLDLAPNGPLSGPNVTIIDSEAPFTTRAEASQPLLFDRSQPQFEEVSAYFQIDRSQRYLQSLGYVGPRRIAGYAIPVDPHAVSGSDNSFYASGDVRGQGALFFGDGGVDDAEDPDIMLHEFGHAIHDSIAPDAFNGSSASEPRAMAEGFGDYWAFSAKYARAIASGRDPYCIGDWDARCWGDDPDQKCSYPAGSDCLRRVDGSRTMADFLRIDESGIEHRNGEIWSSALREILVAMTARYGIDAGRRAADTIVLEGLFGAPSNPTFASQARKLLAADAALNGGVNNDVICRAMTERAILNVGSCGTPPRGELTLFQSVTSTIHIDDRRSIDDVFVRVKTDTASRVSLIAPDGTQILLADALRGDRTFGVDALSLQSLDVLRGRPAAGDWKLVVDGALRSWSLLIRFAGDRALLARPQARELRKHIPAVAHIAGAGNNTFLSDVRIFNRSELAASITAIFTPSGADGNSSFAEVHLNIAPHQLMVLDDILRATFQTTGIGQLELAGDTDRIVVNSRTYTAVARGTLGETVPAFNSVDAGIDDQIAPLQNTSAFRSNVGVAEVSGQSGVVRFSFLTPDGALLATTDTAIAPFSHAQIRVPVAGADLRVQISVVSGNARVIAYGSVVDNLSGDATTIPAQRLPQAAETVAIPTIHALGAGGTNWRTDVWRTTPSGQVLVTQAAGIAVDVLFIDTDGAVISSRTYTTSSSGTLGEFIPAIRAPQGPSLQLIGIEQSAAARTNVGLVNFAAVPAAATVIVYDAAGSELGRAVTTVGPRSLQQLPLTAIVAAAVTDGRIEVRGAVAAYASVIDNGTEDPTYIRGLY